MTLLVLAALGFLAILGSASYGTAQTSAPFGRDLILHETTTSTGMMGAGGKETTSTTYFGANAMRRASSDGRDEIIRFDQGKIVMIDHKRKTYSEMTAQDLQAMFDKMGAEIGRDKEAMEAMKKMMGQIFSQITVTKQGPGENIAGYATVKYLIKGPMEMEVWAAPDLKVPSLYYDALKTRMPPNPMFDMGKIYDEMKKIDGMVLKNILTMSMMGQSMTTTTVVTSVEKGSVPASTFEVPAGYKAVAPGARKF